MHIMTPAVTLANIAKPTQRKITLTMVLLPGFKPALTVKEKKTEASWEWARDRAQRRR